MNDMINGVVLAVVVFLLVVGAAILKTKYDKAQRGGATPSTTTSGTR